MGVLFFLPIFSSYFFLIHVHYQDCSAIIEIPTGNVLEGSLPKNKQKLVDAWIEIHKESLMANLHILAHREHQFWPTVNAHSGRA